jgi:alpha-galactosidase
MFKGIKQRAVFASSFVLAGLSVTLASGSAHAAANGLAQKPPMGWNSWNKFQCDPTLMNDAHIRSIADAMVSKGMLAAGYQYLVMDDCWASKNRDSSGHIVADPAFTTNMLALTRYIHGKGLKVGIYSDRGPQTCQNRAGSFNHEAQDAATFAGWGVDYLKYDNCEPTDAAGNPVRNSTAERQTDYTAMGTALANAGRPIVYSLSAWQFESWMPSVGNLWRTTGDIGASFDSVLTILDSNRNLARFAAPGGWNDPDMLEVGNGMSANEDRAHFSMWAMLAAPLIAGNDVSTMSSVTSSILTNKDVIAVDQDALGAEGTLVRDDGDAQVWSKRLLINGTRAVALLNRGGSSATIAVNWGEVGLSGNLSVKELWSGTTGSSTTGWTASVPAHGVALLKLTGGTEVAKTAPKITITNTDSRAITDLTVTTDFQVTGNPHTDWETVGNFDKTLGLDLDGERGSFNGTAYTGDFLYSQTSASGAKVLTINKVDSRALTNLRITVTFNVNGQPHMDYEDVGTFSGNVNLTLNAFGGTLSGSTWVGDFLHH